MVISIPYALTLAGGAGLVIAALFLIASVLTRHSQTRETAERRRAERKVERILDTSPDIIAVLGMDGVVYEVNRAVEDRLGYTPAELQGSNIAQLVHPADWPLLEPYLSELVRGVSCRNMVVRVVRKDGSAA